MPYPYQEEKQKAALPKALATAPPLPSTPATAKVGRGGIVVPLDRAGPRFTQGAPASGGGGRGRVTGGLTPPSPLAVVPQAQAAPSPAAGGVRTTPSFANRYFQAKPGGPKGAAPPIAPPQVAPAPSAITQEAVRGDLARPGSLPLNPGQGYFRNNSTGAITTFDTPPPTKVAGAAPAVPLQPGQPVEQGQRPVTLPRLNPNLSTGNAIADFINQAATAGETIARNRAAVGAHNRARQTTKDDREALKGDLNALKLVKDLRAPPTFEQVKASRAKTLLDENPVDFTATDQLLFGDRSSTNRRRIVEDAVVGEDGFPTGAKRFYSVDPETGQAVPVELPGGKNAQAGGRPADYPDAYQALTPDGKPAWFVKRNGKTHQIVE